MSSIGNARSAANNEKRTTATSAARPRVLSRVDVKDRSDPGGDVLPQDSASNVGHHRAPSSTHGGGGFNKRRSQKIQLTTKDTLHFRTRSPVKLSAGHDAIDKMSSAQEAARSVSQITDGHIPLLKKGKEALR